MDVSAITNLIVDFVSQIGFPIAVCVVCFWYINKTTEEHKAEVREMNEAHKNEVEQLKDAINNNTNVMQRLMDKLLKE